MIRVDALVVGGGLQGLLILDAISARGHSCLLVSPTELGTGQTLHMHGLLNTGFGFAGHRLRELRDEVVLPALSQLGVSTYGDWYLVGGDDPPEAPSAGAILPRGFDAGGNPVRSLQEVNFSRTQLVAELARLHPDRVLHARVSAWRVRGAVDGVELEPVSGAPPIAIAPNVVVLATGTGTTRVLSVLGALASPFDAIRHRLVHIVCVRGPAEVLPPVDVLSVAGGFNLVSHPAAGLVTWYSTPFQPDDRTFDEVPGDAEAGLDPLVVGDGLDRLQGLFPALKTEAALRFTAYAGFRQDVGDVVGTPLVAVSDQVANLVVALPSLAMNAWQNAAEAAAIVGSMGRPSAQPQVPATGTVRVGPLRDRRPGVRWSTWNEIAPALEGRIRP